MKVKDENSRIRIHWPEARIRGSGSVPKCHGSITLQFLLIRIGMPSAIPVAKLSLKTLPPTTDPVGAGLVPRWGNLNFDPAMLDPPDQDILSDLEQQLGWVK